MTRKRLRQARFLSTCLRYFSSLDGERPSLTMVALAKSCGFTKNQPSESLRRKHRRRTASMRAFLERIRYYSNWASRDRNSIAEFLARPYFDEATLTPSEYFEVLLENDEAWYLVPALARPAATSRRRPFVAADRAGAPVPLRPFASVRSLEPSEYVEIALADGAIWYAVPDRIVPRDFPAAYSESGGKTAVVC